MKGEVIYDKYETIDELLFWCYTVNTGLAMLFASIYPLHSWQSECYAMWGLVCIFVAMFNAPPEEGRWYFDRDGTYHTFSWNRSKE